MFEYTISWASGSETASGYTITPSTLFAYDSTVVSGENFKAADIGKSWDVDLYLKDDETKHHSVNIPVQDSYASGTVAVETGIQKEVGSTLTSADFDGKVTAYLASQNSTGDKVSVPVANISFRVGSTEAPLVTSYQVPHFDDTDLSVYVYVGINGQTPVSATVATIDVVKSAN